MIIISSVELQRDFGTYLDKAMTEPVVVTRNEREQVVILSADEFRRLARPVREALAVGALTDEELEAIARTEMASRHAYLDDELK
jgi:prevent-host-death family protein